MKLSHLAISAGAAALVTSATWAVLQGLGVGGYIHASVLGGLVGAHFATALHARLPSAVASTSVKTAFGSAIAVVTLSLGLVAHLKFGGMRHPVATLVLSTIGSFVFPFVVFAEPFRPKQRSNDPEVLEAIALREPPQESSCSPSRISHDRPYLLVRTILRWHFYSLTAILAIAASINYALGGEPALSIMFIFPLLAALALHLRKDIWRRRVLRGCIMVFVFSLVFLWAALFKEMKGDATIPGVALSGNAVVGISALLSAIVSGVPAYMLMTEKALCEFD